MAILSSGNINPHKTDEEVKVQWTWMIWLQNKFPVNIKYSDPLILQNPYKNHDYNVLL